MGEGTKVQVVFFRVVRLQLSTIFFLELQDVVYIPSIRKNLIFVPILDRHGFSFLFGIEKFELYLDCLLVGNGILCGNLCILELYGLPFVYVSFAINIVSSAKHLRLNKKSSILWHKRLGHTSKLRMERLIKYEILSDLNFSYFDTCVDCIKGKLIAKIMNVNTDR